MKNLANKLPWKHARLPLENINCSVESEIFSQLLTGRSYFLQLQVSLFHLSGPIELIPISSLNFHISSCR